MTYPDHPCRLLDRNNRVVAAARCTILPAAHGWQAVLSAFDRPGQVAKRLLLQQVRDIRIEFEDGVAFPAQVERVSYDSTQGHVCTVRLTTVPPLAVSPSALSTGTSVPLAAGTGSSTALAARV